MFAPIILVFALGLFFRLKGIEGNHSFWADEADVSSYARDFIEGKIALTQVIQNTYQPMQNLLVAVSFKLFGISELSARFPTVLFSSLGIVFAYLLAARLSNYAGGLLAAFLYAFSQLNLAHATQVKPYAVIETSVLAVSYLILLLSQTKLTHEKHKLHLWIIIILAFSSFLHPEAFLTWIIYLIYLLTTIKFNPERIVKKPVFVILALAFLITAGIGLKLPSLLATFLIPDDFKSIFANANTTYLRELFWRNYAFITMPAIIGFLVTFRSHKALTRGLLVWALLLILIWNFRAFHNVRYLVPIFGLLFVYFGVFWAIVGEKLMNKKSALVCMLVAILLFTGGYKISRKPLSFYNPNSDLLADIQIADYKTAFAQLKNKFPDYEKMVIFNSFLDPQRWYLRTHPTVYFSKGLGENSIPHGLDQHPIYGNLNNFLKEKGNYKQGLLVVEDWQSILPDDIKEYAKKNLKREIRVEGLRQANGDNWPIEIYSWGM